MNTQELVAKGLGPTLMEAFYTIQGEGRFTGHPAYFIRLGGCDVGCVWCDVKESWDSGKWPVLSIEKIVEDALAYPGRLVVITGGEPLMYPKINAEADNAYVEALKEILKSAPEDKTEIMNEYAEDVSADVEFSMKDTKFLNVTLKDSIILALKNNYEIRIAKMDPMIKENDITVAKSEFDPTLTVTGDVEDSEEASNSGVLIGTGGGLVE